MSLSDLPPLREQLEAHGLMAKKSFGQHFLLDLNVTRKIVRLGGPFTDQTLIEVGPGPGGLTRALLESDAKKVIAIEMDPRFLPLLSDLSNATEPGRFEVIEGDAVKVDELAILAERGLTDGAHLVSNLPYNVGTHLLIKWLTGPFHPASMTLMFQKEVAERIIAKPGSDAYGRLAIITQACCHAEIIVDLPARAFTPPPKVNSAVVHLKPRANYPDDQLLTALERITSAAFGQRRKMIRSSLKALPGGPGVEALCEASGIAADIRAETLGLKAFLKLAHAYLGRDMPKEQTFTLARRPKAEG